MRRANVYYRDTLAGVLSQDSGGYVFEYLPALLGESRLAGNQSDSPQAARPFFNRLCYSHFSLACWRRERISRCNAVFCRIDEDDHFTRLLRTCTTETIGGITVKEIS